MTTTAPTTTVYGRDLRAGDVILRTVPVALPATYTAGDYVVRVDMVRPTYARGGQWVDITVIDGPAPAPGTHTPTAWLIRRSDRVRRVVNP